MAPGAPKVSWSEPVALAAVVVLPHSACSGPTDLLWSSRTNWFQDWVSETQREHFDVLRNISDPRLGNLEELFNKYACKVMCDSQFTFLSIKSSTACLNVEEPKCKSSASTACITNSSTMSDIACPFFHPIALAVAGQATWLKRSWMHSWLGAFPSTGDPEQSWTSSIRNPSSMPMIFRLGCSISILLNLLRDWCFCACWKQHSKGVMGHYWSRWNTYWIYIEWENQKVVFSE